MGATLGPCLEALAALAALEGADEHGELALLKSFSRIAMVDFRNQDAGIHGQFGFRTEYDQVA